jgi:hypothetical protein
MHRMINVYGPAVYNTCEMFAAHFAIGLRGAIACMQWRLKFNSEVKNICLSGSLFHERRAELTLAESLVLSTLCTLCLHET